MAHASFPTWIFNDSRKKVLLCELSFCYESASLPVEGKIYLANHPFTSGATDAPASQPYRDCIKAMPAMRRELDPQTLTGAAALSIGDLVLDNPDGQLDFLLKAIVDGRDIRFYLGDADWARNDFQLVLVACMQRVVAANESEITIKLTDRRILLDARVGGNAIGGSGPAARQLAPLVLNYSRNLELTLYDSTALTYKVASNYSELGLLELRDSGVAFATDTPFTGVTNANLTANTGTEVLSLTSHGLIDNDVVSFAGTDIFAGLSLSTEYWVISSTANTFKLSATRGGAAVDITGSTFSGSLTCSRKRYKSTLASDGLIQMASSPAGRITATVWISSGYLPFALMSSLISTYGGLASSDIDSSAFSAADTALAAKLQLAPTYSAMHSLVLKDQVNLIDLLVEISNNAFGWFGIDYQGRVTAGIIDPPTISTQAAARTLTASEVDADGIGIENIPIGVGTATLYCDRNETIQTDGLASSLTAAQRDIYGRPFRVQAASTIPGGTGYVSRWWTYHKAALLGAQVESTLHEDWSPASALVATAQQQVDALVADNAPFRQVVNLNTFLQAWDWGLGDVVRFTYPRYGLDAGVNFRIIGIQSDLARQRIGLTLLRQAVPDTTTASYN